MVRRLFTLVPLVASASAVALMIVLLASGSHPSSGNSTYWLALNTSKIGQNVIQFTPADTSSSSDPLSGFLDGLDGIFGGLLSNITGQIDSGIQDIEGEILGNLTKAIGIKDVYTLFLTQMCGGTYANSDNPNSDVTFTSCSTYDDESAGLRNITDSIPSSLVVGTTNISVPLISSLGSTIGSVTNLVTQGAKALFALLIISTVSVGLMMVGSALILVLGYRRLLVDITTVFGVLGASVMLLFAATTTGVIVVGSNTINDIGAGFGLETKTGQSFLAMSWVSAALSALASSFWFAVWFVDFRRTSFKRRWRTEQQIGNYRGIGREILGDLRVPKGGAPISKEASLPK